MWTPPGLSLNASSGLISGTPTQAGTYTASVSATNAFGTFTGALIVTVSVPTADVTGIDILSPPSNINIVQGETIALLGSVDALPGALANVNYSVYDATDKNLVLVLGNAGVALDGFNWSPTTLGDFTFRVTATDTAGNSFPASIPIHVVTSPSAAPNSVLLSGLDGKTFAAGSTLPLVGLVTDASGTPLSNAKFYINGVPVPTTTNSTSDALETDELRPRDEPANADLFAQALFTVGSALEDALLTVVGTDSHGVTSVSSAATLRITAAANVPICAITSPATGEQVRNGVSVPVSALAAESGGSIAQVEFFKDNTSVGKARVAPYTLSIPLSEEGQFALTAIATDTNGISQASKPVIVTVGRPVVTIAVAGNGEAVAGGKPGKATVKRTGDTKAPLKVRFRLAGAAKAGVNYKALPSGTVTIPAGKLEAKIEIEAIENPNVAGPLVAKIKLLSSTNDMYTLGTETTAKIELIDN